MDAVSAFGEMGTKATRATRHIVRWVGLGACLLLIATTFFSYRSLNKFEESGQWIAHTQQVLYRVSGVLSALVEVEAAERGFQLTGNDKLLGGYDDARLGLPAQLAELKMLTQDNVDQARRVEKLQQLALRRLALAAEVIESKKNRGDTDALQLADNVAAGNRLTGGIRDIAAKIASEEQGLLENRTRAYGEDAARTKIWLIAGKVGALFLLIAAYFLLQTEISRRAQAEQRRLHASREIEDLYNNAPCGYHSVDRNGFITRINDTQLAWLGYRREEVIGKLRHPDLMTRESAVRFENEIFPLFMRQGWLKEVEFDYRRKDGSVMPGLLNATAVYDEAGKYLWSRTTLYDISARRQIEERLLEMHRSLDQRAQELQAANAELESFGYSISHDLRAPLRAIDGYARMVEEDYGPKVDEEGRRRLAIIRQSSRKMGELIDDLLAFSHIGRREKYLQDTDMKDLVETAWGDVSAGNEAGRTPELVIGTLPRAWVDRALFAQVWVNLLSNAWKYSSKNESPRVTVSAVVRDHEIEYRIDDNGVGFDMRYYDKLFGVFQRLHTEREFPGTGVGLAIVQRVVGKHGGRVWGEGRPGQGATFYFTLPRQERT